MPGYYHSGFVFDSSTLIAIGILLGGVHRAYYKSSHINLEIVRWQRRCPSGSAYEMLNLRGRDEGSVH